jgi:hypothetical protein
VTKRLPADLSTALTALWMQRGDAIDLICSIKRRPDDPRNSELAEIESTASRLEERLLANDVLGATALSYLLTQLVFKLRASEAKRYVEMGRKQDSALKSRRDAHNLRLHDARSGEWARWNEEAKPYWASAITKNAVARIVQSKLGLKDAISTIAKRLKKPRQPS